jgi:hypothetical protein
MAVHALSQDALLLALSVGQSHSRLHPEAVGGHHRDSDRSRRADREQRVRATALLPSLRPEADQAMSEQVWCQSGASFGIGVLSAAG